MSQAVSAERESRQPRTKIGRKLGRASRAGFALLVGLLFLFPLYVAWVTSLDTAAHVFTVPPHLIPDFDFNAYRRVWHMARWLMYLGNTVFITAVTLAIALSSSVLSAYALSFFHFKGRNTVFMSVLIVLMIPAEALLIPNYVILQAFHLLNTYWAQILPYGASVFGVFLLRQFFLSLPDSYRDAAKLDGAGHLRFLWSIALPVAKPALFTVGLYIFIGCWNSFQWPLIVSTSHSVQPVEVAVSRLMMAHSVDWRRLSAAGIMTTLPLVMAFFILQRHIVRGIRRGEGLQE